MKDGKENNFNTFEKKNLERKEIDKYIYLFEEMFKWCLYLMSRGKNQLRTHFQTEYVKLRKQTISLCTYYFVEYMYNLDMYRNLTHEYVNLSSIPLSDGIMGRT